MICNKCKARPALNSGLCHHCSLLVDTPRNTAFRLKRDFQKQFSYVYFVDIDHGEQIKIGITAQPFDRMLTYEKSFKSVESIGFMVGDVNKEREIQNLFRMYAIHPEKRVHEWFYWHQDIIEYARKNTKSMNMVYKQILKQWKQFKVESLSQYGHEVYSYMDLPTCLTSRLR